MILSVSKHGKGIVRCENQEVSLKPFCADLGNHGVRLLCLSVDSIWLPFDCGMRTKDRLLV